MQQPVKVGREIALAGATGAVALVSPAGLPPRALLAYRLVSATLAGAYTYESLGRDQDVADRRELRVALAVGAGGGLFATMGVWERWDSALSRWLVARGVRHPRLVIAAGTVATSLASGLMEAWVGPASGSKPPLRHGAAD